MCRIKSTSLKLSDYALKVSNENKKPIDNKSQKDNVLDLSEGNELLSDELNNQQTDKIKFIKIKDSKNRDVLLEINLVDSDATEIVSKLKEDIIEKGNIKETFGGIIFSGAGIDVKSVNTGETGNSSANIEELSQSAEGKTFKEKFELIKNFVKLTHTPLNIIQDKLIQKNLKDISKIIEAIKFDDFVAAKGLKPAQLADDLEAQIRLALLSKDTNNELIKDLSETLDIPAESITGKPKAIDRILDKMIKGKKELGDIGDLTRARASFDKLDAELIGKIETEFRGILETKFGKENVEWDSVLTEANKDYRGRVNVNINLKSGMKFEFQLGSSQISTLYGTRFKLLNGTTKTNFHDVFYKGVDYYLMSPQNEKFLANVGGGDIEKGKSILGYYRQAAMSGSDVRGLEKGNRFLKEYGTAARDFGSTVTVYKANIAPLIFNNQTVKTLGPYNAKKQSELFTMGEKVIKKGLEEIGDGDINNGLKELQALKGSYTKMLDKVTEMSNQGMLLVNLKDPKLKPAQVKEFEELIKKGKAIDFPLFVKENGNVIEGLDKVFAKVSYNSYLPKLLQGAAAKALKDEKLAPQIAKSLEVIKLLGKRTKLDKETINTLENLAKDPNFLKDENAFKNLLLTVEKATKEDHRVFKGFIETIKSGNPATLAKSFKSEQAGEEILQVGRKILPIVEKLGIKESATIAAKIGAGLSKALPVIGGLASGFDTVRLTGIALTGKDMLGPDYNKYPAGDPRDTPENNAKLKDLRVLALIGAQLNAIDTLLAVVEVTGVGNIDLPVQLALCAAEIAVDIALYQFYEHPEQMPKEMSLVLKASALGMAATGVLNPAAAGAVFNIYGLAGTIDIAAEFTKAVGEAGLSGAKHISDMQTKLLDKSMKGTAQDLHIMADMIRNPVKYVEKFGKSVEEIKEKAIESLGNAIKLGGESALKAYFELQHLINQKIPEVSAAAWQALSRGGEKAVEFVVDGINSGTLSIAEAIRGMNEQADQLIDKTIKLGGKALDKLIEYGKDPSIALKDAEALAKGIAGGIVSGLISLDKGLNYLLNAGENGYEAIKELIANGGKLAADVYKKSQAFMAKAGDKAKELGLNIARGISDLIDQGGDKAKEIVEAIARDPAGFVRNCGKEAEEVIRKAALYLYKSAASGVETAVESLKNLYDKTGKYLVNLKNEAGAAIGRFEDTLGALWKKGVGLKNEWIDKNIEIFKKNWPEIQKGFADIGDASKEQLEKMGYFALKAAAAGAENAIDFAADTYYKLAAKGEAAINEIVCLGNAISSQVKDFNFKVADTLQGLGENGLERLKDIGYAGMLRLRVLAENGTKIAYQGNLYFQRSAEIALEELKKIIDDPLKYGKDKGEQAKNVIIDLAEKAIENVKSLNEKGLELAKKAMNFIPGGPEAIEIARKALKKAEEVKGKALELGILAIHNLREMGGKGVDTLAEYAQKTGILAQEAWKELKNFPEQAIETFKLISINGGQLADLALKELSEMGDKAINALQVVVLSGGEFAGLALHKLMVMGDKAINAIKEIIFAGCEFSEKAIELLMYMGEKGIETLKEIANNPGEAAIKAVNILIFLGITVNNPEH